MSTKNEKLSLVARIMVVLGLDEAGKITKFFDKEKREFTRSIEKLTMNAKNQEANYISDLQDLKDELEDAVEAYEDAKTQIVPEDVANNAAMTSFATTYWGRIDRANETVGNIAANIEGLTKIHEAWCANNNVQIDKYKNRIAILNEKK